MRRLIFAGILVLTGTALAAQSVSTRGRTDLFRNQLDILDNRAAQQYNGSIRLAPKPVVIPGTPGAKTTKPYSGKYRGPLISVARAAARKHRVPEDLFLRLVNQESRWNATARSHKGALGLAQLMPGTAKYLGVRNALDPKQNLEGGAKYLAEQHREFGSWRLALAAYNAGPGAVRKYKGVPPFKETRNYVKVILGE